MSWVVLALLSAVLAALSNAVVKRATRDTDNLVIAWGLSVAALPVAWAAALWQGLPAWETEILWLALASGVLNTAVLVLSVSGLEKAELSVAAPLRSTTPAFLLLISPFILGESPSLQGAAGVLVIVGGMYLLYAEPGEGFLTPLRSLVRQPGPRLILLAAATGALAASVDKLGVRAASPAVWSAIAFTGIVLGLSAAVWTTRRTRVPDADEKMAWGTMALAGLLLAGASLAQMFAFELGLAAYVIALKRTSGPIGVLLGGWAFNEGGIRQRLVGAAVIAAGVTLVATG